jgi:hypothetical protein
MNGGQGQNRTADTHIASMRNAPDNFPDGNSPAQNPPTVGILKYTIPAYTIYDAALGVTKDNWTAQIQGANITNVYGPTNISSAQCSEWRRGDPFRLANRLCARLLRKA